MRTVKELEPYIHRLIDVVMAEKMPDDFSQAEWFICLVAMAGSYAETVGATGASRQCFALAELAYTMSLERAKGES